MSLHFHHKLIEQLLGRVSTAQLLNQLFFRQLDSFGSPAWFSLDLWNMDPRPYFVDPLVMLPYFFNKTQNPQNLAALIDPSPDRGRVNFLAFVLIG